MGVVSVFQVASTGTVMTFLPGVPVLDSTAAPHHGAAADDTIYISMCSGGVMVKMSVAEQAQFILGQLSILGVAIVVTLAELAIWLAN
jgi:hypothetical protein